MDASNNDTGSRRVSRSTHAVGGKVEPANRVELVRAQYHTPWSRRIATSCTTRSPR